MPLNLCTLMCIVCRDCYDRVMRGSSMRAAAWSNVLCITLVELTQIQGPKYTLSGTPAVIASRLLASSLFIPWVWYKLLPCDWFQGCEEVVFRVVLPSPIGSKCMDKLLMLQGAKHKPAKGGTEWCHFPFLFYEQQVGWRRQALTSPCHYQLQKRFWCTEASCPSLMHAYHRFDLMYVILFRQRPAQVMDAALCLLQPFSLLSMMNSPHVSKCTYSIQYSPGQWHPCWGGPCGDIFQQHLGHCMVGVSPGFVSSDLVFSNQTCCPCLTQL